MKFINNKLRPPRAIFSLTLLLGIALAQLNTISHDTRSALFAQRRVLESLSQENNRNHRYGLTSGVFYQSAESLAYGLSFDTKSREDENMKLLCQLLDRAHANQIPAVSQHCYWSVNSVLQDKAHLAVEESDIHKARRLYLYRARVVRANLEQWQTNDFLSKLDQVHQLLRDLEEIRDFLTPELTLELKLIKKELHKALVWAYDIDQKNALDVYEATGEYLKNERNTETSEEFDLKTVLVSLVGTDLMKDHQILGFLEASLSDRERLLNLQVPESEHWATRAQRKNEIESEIAHFLSSQEPVLLP